MHTYIVKGNAESNFSCSLGFAAVITWISPSYIILSCLKPRTVFSGFFLTFSVFNFISLLLADEGKDEKMEAAEEKKG